MEVSDDSQATGVICGIKLAEQAGRPVTDTEVRQTKISSAQGVVYPSSGAMAKHKK